MNRGPWIQPVPRASWYLRHARYRAYMLRELTCVLTAVYSVLLLCALAALASGQPQQWDDFLAGQQHGGWVAFHAVSLAFFTVFQTMPWFRLAPKAMALQWRGSAVPPAAIIAAHYLAWIAITLAVFLLLGVF